MYCNSAGGSINVYRDSEKLIFWETKFRLPKSLHRKISFFLQIDI